MRKLAAVTVFALILGFLAEGLVGFIIVGLAIAFFVLVTVFNIYAVSKHYDENPDSAYHLIRDEEFWW